MTLNRTCCHGPYCDLLIAYQDEAKVQLPTLFGRYKPDAIDNQYLVIGTLDLAA